MIMCYFKIRCLLKMFVKEVYYYYGLIVNFIVGLYGILYLSFILNICLNYIFCFFWKIFVCEREKISFLILYVWY